MKFTKYLLTITCAFLTGIVPLNSANQTPDVSPITPQYFVPFFVDVEQVDLSLPSGIQSFVRGTYKGKWILLAGRVNGLHNFNNDNNNFPPSQQNRTVYVVDIANGTVHSRSLLDPNSGLTQEQIDILSVTSAQYYQHKNTLYMSGGYGVNTATGLFDTKPVLTAIDMQGLIQWVVDPNSEPLSESVRQLRDPVFQVTGGYMTRSLKGLSLLIFGQNYFTFYVPGQNGIYSEQVRRFKIKDNGKTLSVKVLEPSPQIGPNAFYRRRDLNVIPIMQAFDGLPLPAYIALSGVFTETGGIWTVPVYISTKGWPSMANPSDPGTFKQGMNNYNCPVLSTFSERTGNMFTTLFGGLSYGYFDTNGTFQTDEEIPFINQITTVQIDKRGNINQFLMDDTYPVVISQGSNPGNQLLFGAGANFIPVDNLSTYKNGVIKLDKIKYPTVVGYIVGGIASTLPNTVSSTDSTASPLIFKVTLKPTAPQD